MDFKRGDRLVRKGILWDCKGNHPEHTYRFRIDPVPFFFKGTYRFRNWYKFPKTTQEKKWSYAHKEYARGRRTGLNLPNAWDDYQRGDVRTRKSWKNKKIKKQWMKRGCTSMVDY
jgi:hypothetical protein